MTLTDPAIPTPHPSLDRAYRERGYVPEVIRRHLEDRARKARMGSGIAVAPVSLPAPVQKHVPIPEPKASKTEAVQPKSRVALPSPRAPRKWSPNGATRRKQIDEVLKFAPMRERAPIEPPKVKSRAARVVLRAAGETIARETAMAYGLTLAKIQGASRRNEISCARQEATYRMRRELNLSFPDIARVLKRKDHTGAIWGIWAHERRVAALKARIEVSA